MYGGKYVSTYSTVHWEGHIGAALLAYAPVGGITLALGFDTFGPRRRRGRRRTIHATGL